MDSFTVCSDSGNNSTNKLFNQLIYAYGISLSSNAWTLIHKLKFRHKKYTNLEGNRFVWNMNSKDWERKGIWFQKGSKYLEIFLLRNGNRKIHLTNVYKGCLSWGVSLSSFLPKKLRRSELMEGKLKKYISIREICIDRKR